MRRTASEVLNDLEARIERLERTAAYNSRAEPRKAGPRNLADMVADADYLLEKARRAGYRGAKIQYRGDVPVLVLDRGTYVFFDERGYTLENPQGGEFFTYKIGDIVTRIQGRPGSFGGESDFEEQVEIPASMSDVAVALEDWMGESWRQTGATTFVGGPFTLALKLQPTRIHFTLTGPAVYIPRGVAKGVAMGEGRMEQVIALKERLDAIAERAGKRKTRENRYILKMLQYK